MLEKGKNRVLPCSRNSMGALDTALSSIPFGVCAFRFPRQPQALFKTAVRIFKSSFSQKHYFADFFDPTRCPKRFANHNDTRTKQSHNPYRPDAGPLIAEKMFFSCALCSSKTSSKQAKDMAGLRCSWMSCWNWKWKTWKRSFPARPQKLSGRCENEAFVLETSLKDWMWKMGKWSIMKLSCETSKTEWKMWKWSFRQLWWWWQWWVIVVDVMW